MNSPHAESTDFDAYANWLGIPRKEQPPNLYRLLGLPLFEADREAIERAADARMALLKTHQTGRYQALSQRLLNEVAAARLCLLSGERKARYDAVLREQLKARRNGQVPIEQLLPPELPASPQPSRWQCLFAGAGQFWSWTVKSISPRKWALRLWLLLVLALLAAYVVLVWAALGKRGTPTGRPNVAEPSREPTAPQVETAPDAAGPSSIRGKAFSDHAESTQDAGSDGR